MCTKLGSQLQLHPHVLWCVTEIDWSPGQGHTKMIIAINAVSWSLFFRSTYVASLMHYMNDASYLEGCLHLRSGLIAMYIYLWWSDSLTSMFHALQYSLLYALQRLLLNGPLWSREPEMGLLGTSKELLLQTLISAIWIWSRGECMLAMDAGIFPLFCTSSNPTPGSRSYSDHVNAWKDSLCTH